MKAGKSAVVHHLLSSDADVRCDFLLGFLDYLVEQKLNGASLDIYPSVRDKLKTDDLFRHMFFGHYQERCRAGLQPRIGVRTLS